MAWMRAYRYARSLRPRPLLPVAATGFRPPPAESPPPLLVLTSLLPCSPPRAGRMILAPLFERRWFSSPGWVDAPQGAVVEVPLAQTGEGIAECELLKWFVQEGDEVEEFQPLCEVQSDKATIEITSRFKGKVHQILYIPGDIVKVGDTFLKLFVEDSQNPTSDGHDDRVSMASELSESKSHSSSTEKDTVGGVLSTTAVRHLAKQYGLNINDICGTGKDGRVLKEDVLHYAASKGIIEETASISQSHSDKAEPFKEGKAFVDERCDEDTILPLRGFQRSMLKSMTMAAKVPHFYYLEEINCEALAEIKEAFQNANTDQDVKHTFLPVFIKSLSMALSKYPLLNSSFKEESSEVILKGCHNIGVAMATSYGLVVPNIKKVQSLSILEITKELARLHQMASNNKLSAEDITGGTITLSNIGSIGGKFGTPLLNLPEVSIIAVGRIQKLPRFADDGTVYPASVTNVTIGADHRVVDGATVARFCNEWKLLIENPELLLLHMR